MNVSDTHTVASVMMDLTHTVASVVMDSNDISRNILLCIFVALCIETYDNDLHYVHDGFCSPHKMSHGSGLIRS